jgi:hypothetical protein
MVKSGMGNFIVVWGMMPLLMNGIPESRKNRNRNSDFRLEWFSGFPILFSAGNFRNFELGSGIPDSGRPRNRYPKSEFPTKQADYWLLAIPAGRMAYTITRAQNQTETQQLVGRGST